MPAAAADAAATQSYLSSTDMWQAESGTDEKKAEWYNKAVGYWEKQPETYDGVLGGYGYVSSIDARDSAAFLKKVSDPLSPSLLSWPLL